jgi:hypothetical protein
MTVRSGLAVYGGGFVVNAGAKPTAAEQLADLQEELKALAEQVEGLWARARAAGLVREADEPTANQAGDELVIQMAIPTASAPAIVGPLSRNGHYPDVAPDADVFIQLVPPLP